VNDYYLNLIDWSDPADPIRRLVIPDAALVLTAATCGAYCRYCFRKRLFMRHNTETARDMTPAFEYVARHPEITDVLLTGGDPLVLGIERLGPVVRKFAAMPHVRTVPLVEGWRLFDEARRGCSGLSRRVRFAMSHASGKIEVLGVDADRIHMRYHRARNPHHESRIMVARRDDEACWFDDLQLVS